MNDSNQREKLLRQALNLAEKNHGLTSSEVGICLMELADFIEAEGRSEEAEMLTARYRNILLLLSKELGLLIERGPAG